MAGRILYTLLAFRVRQWFIQFSSTLCLIEKIPDILAVTLLRMLDFNNFWQQCFAESRQLKCGIIFHLARLVYLHYLVKLEAQKLHLFTNVLCVALLTKTKTHQNYHLVIDRLSFIHKTINCILQT